MLYTVPRLSAVDYLEALASQFVDASTVLRGNFRQLRETDPRSARPQQHSEDLRALSLAVAWRDHHCPPSIVIKSAQQRRDKASPVARSGNASLRLFLTVFQ